MRAITPAPEEFAAYLADPDGLTDPPQRRGMSTRPLVDLDLGALDRLQELVQRPGPPRRLR